jgi:hypothetical protein
LTGGAIGGLTAGISGAFQGARAGIGALPGARAALSSAFSPSNVFSNLGGRIAERGLFNAYQGPDFNALAQQQQAAQQAAQAPQPVAGPTTAGQGVTPPDTVLETTTRAPSQPSMFDRLLGRTPGGEGTGLTGEARVAEINRLQTAYPKAPPAEILRIVDGAPKTLLQQYGPAAAGSLAVAAAAGAFNPIEQPAPPTPGYEQTSSELLAQNPQLYSVGVPQAPSRASFSDIAVPPSYSSVVPQLPPIYTPPVAPINFQPLQYAAQGGEMANFPRRMGAIDGPGTETSDDVPAMLSDGEFVMTARAVRGAGNGDRQQGVRRMYDMMRMFEGGVAR